jgi:hypothetical protein
MLCDSKLFYFSYCLDNNNLRRWLKSLAQVLFLVSKVSEQLSELQNKKLGEDNASQRKNWATQRNALGQLR